MSRTVALIALSLLVPGALAEGAEVTVVGILAASQTLDADGSYLPDPADMVLCGLDTSSPDDGTCTDGAFSPPAPVGPLDADSDDVPDQLEAPVCGATPPAALGSCEDGDLAPSSAVLAAVACADDASTCAFASQGRLVRVCTSSDPLAVKGCIEDFDGDGRLLLQEILVCSDPTDPTSTEAPATADPTQCGILLGVLP